MTRPRPVSPGATQIAGSSASALPPSSSSNSASVSSFAVTVPSPQCAASATGTVRAAAAMAATIQRNLGIACLLLLVIDGGDRAMPQGHRVVSLRYRHRAPAGVLRCCRLGDEGVGERNGCALCERPPLSYGL